MSFLPTPIHPSEPQLECPILCVSCPNVLQRNKRVTLAAHTAWGALPDGISRICCHFMGLGASWDCELLGHLSIPAQPGALLEPSPTHRVKFRYCLPIPPLLCALPDTYLPQPDPIPLKLLGPAEKPVSVRNAPSSCFGSLWVARSPSHSCRGL